MKTIKKRKPRKVLTQESKQSMRLAWEYFYIVQDVENHILERFYDLGIVDQFPTDKTPAENLINAISILEDYQMEKKL